MQDKGEGQKQYHVLSRGKRHTASLKLFGMFSSKELKGKRLKGVSRKGTAKKEARKVSARLWRASCVPFQTLL